MTKEINLKLENNTLLSINKNKNVTSEIKYQHQKTKKAFTLLELLVVIAILGMLAAFVVPNVIDAKNKAQRDITCTQMNSIEAMLDNFKMDNSNYPESEEGLQALISNPDPDKYPQYSAAGYTKKLPKDSWGKAFTYLKTEDGFKMISYAADRKEGGTGGDEDIIYPGCKK